MNTFNFLLLLCGEFPSVHGLYSFFINLGGIGFLLGFWRWWLSVLWFIFPTSLILAGYLLVHISDVYAMYSHVTFEMGENYLLHNYTALTLGFLLNISGFFIKTLVSKKLKLQ